MDEKFGGLTARVAILVLLVAVAAYWLIAAAWRGRRRKPPALEITARHAPGLRGLP